MLRILCIPAAFAILVLCDLAAGAEQVLLYEIELIRGTDSAEPPAPAATQASSESLNTLRGVLKPKHYWQIFHRSTALLPGRTVRLDLSNGREVEIDLT
jgi:hypothetical protein